MKKSFRVFLFCMCFFCFCKTPTIPVDPPAPEFSDGNAQFDHWIHSPLHPGDFEPVMFSLQVTDPKGILKVELELFEYELYNNAEGLASKRRTPLGAWAKVKDWEWTEPRQSVDLEFLYERGFAPRSNVVYQFSVINQEKERSQKWAMFDAGQSPWPQDKILLYATSDEVLKNNLNVCFLADVDYQGDRRSFLNDVETLIYGGYHANNMIGPHKDKWAFYYTQQEANGRAIISDYFNEANYPAFMRDSFIMGIDAFGLIHKNEYSDGALLMGNIAFLSNNMFTSESYNLGTAVHETAHAIFGLSDEYEGCACFEGAAGSNMFPDLLACQNFNAENGFPTQQCTKLLNWKGENWYMSERSVHFDTRAECEAFNRSEGYDPGNCQAFINIHGRQFYRSLEGLCIMQDDGDTLIRDFKATCSTIIQDVYGQMSSRTLPGDFVGLEKLDNIFGLEPSIVMEFEMDPDKMNLAVLDVDYAVPQKEWLPGDDVLINWFDEAGQSQKELSLERPGRIIVHRNNNTDIFDVQSTSSCQFFLAYNDQMQKASCLRNEPEGTYGTTAKSGVQIFDLKEQIRAKYSKFKSKVKQR